MLRIPDIRNGHRNEPAVTKGVATSERSFLKYSCVGDRISQR